MTTDKFNESTINELSKDKRFLIVNSGKKWILIETKDEIYRTINKIHEHEKMAIVVEEKYLETDTKAIAHAAVDFL